MMRFLYITLAVLGICSCGTIISPRGSGTREKAEVIPSDASIRGNIAYGMRSFFRIAMDEETLLSMTVQGERISLALEDENGRTLKRIATMIPGQAEAVPNLYLSNGSYYLIVERAYGGSTRETAYTAVLSRKRISVSSEREDNGDAGRAQELTLPAIVSGYYAPSMDVERAESKPAYTEEDWYSIDGKESDSAIDIELSPVPGVIGVLCIADDNGTLFLADGGESGEGKSITGILLPAMMRRYIVIRTERQVSSKFPYQLRVSGKALSQGYAYEPNDSRARAIALVEGMLISGRIDAPRDVEMFRIPRSPADAGIRIRAPMDIAVTVVLFSEAHEATATLHTPANSADIIVSAAALTNARMISIRGTVRGSRDVRAWSRNPYEIIFSRAVE
ncbi:MAG: hypothetical protein AABZ39_08620 [Spirochaetota bacterium]